MAAFWLQENPQVKDIGRIYPGEQLRISAPEQMRNRLGKESRKTKAGKESQEGRLKEESMSPTQVQANKGEITF